MSLIEVGETGRNFIYEAPNVIAVGAGQLAVVNTFAHTQNPKTVVEFRFPELETGDQTYLSHALTS